MEPMLFPRLPRREHNCTENHRYTLPYRAAPFPFKRFIAKPALVLEPVCSLSRYRLDLSHNSARCTSLWETQHHSE
eukprot:3438565-Pyramimonas_sp.AAC.1